MKLAINLGDVLSAICVIALTCMQKELPAILIVLCLILSKLSHIQSTLAERNP